jgi:hypothetical protein
VKIRLEGTKQEIDWLVESLAKTYSITKPMKLYPNRDGTYRAYVELTPFFVTSGSATDSKAQTQVTTSDEGEPRPKSGDMVLGG